MAFSMIKKPICDQALREAAESAYSDFKRSVNPFDYQEYISSAVAELGFSVQGHRHLKEKPSKHFKSGPLSDGLREAGNKLFLRKNDLLSLEEALECYTMCIAYAPVGSKELALGFANRSAVLLKLDRPDECMKDIERAVQNGYPQESMAKLWIRRAEAYAKLADHSCIAAKYWLDETPVRDAGRAQMVETLQKYSASKYMDTIDAELRISKLESQSSKYPYVSDAIEIQYSGSTGRKIVATRDIQVGENLFIDNPYTTFPYTKFLYTHCNMCLSNHFVGIPCDSCVYAVYCSEKCKKDAWEKYHHLECPVMEVIMEYNESDYHRTHCLRILLHMHHEAGGLQQLRNKVGRFYNFHEHDVGEKEKWYREKSLETVLLLDTATNIKTVIPEKIKDAGITAILGVFYLATLTDFFGIRHDLEKESELDVINMSQSEDVKFIGALLLKVTLILQHNSNNWMEVVETFPDLKITRPGSIVLPFQGIMKISCHPNVTGICSGIDRNICATRSLLPIKKGEELVRHCGKFWYIDSEDERMRFMKHLEITCTCLACENKWPLLNSLISYKKTLKSASKAKMSRLVGQFYQLNLRLHKGDVTDKLKIMEDLKRIFKNAYEIVDMPCKELVEMWQAIGACNIMFLGKSSKLKKLHLS